MPSRRYYIAILPVEHINGKMAPVADKCPNSYDPAEPGTYGYMYGYKRKWDNVSRFGIRVTQRNLNDHPYTTAEEENRTLFTASLQAARAGLAVERRRAKAQAEFESQNNYATLLGYCVAACRELDGQWPPRWR